MFPPCRTNASSSSISHHYVRNTMHRPAWRPTEEGRVRTFPGRRYDRKVKCPLDHRAPKPGRHRRQAATLCPKPVKMADTTKSDFCNKIGPPLPLRDRLSKSAFWVDQTPSLLPAPYWPWKVPRVLPKLKQIQRGAAAYRSCIVVPC